LNSLSEKTQQTDLTLDKGVNSWINISVYVKAAIAAKKGSIIVRSTLITSTFNNLMPERVRAWDDIQCRATSVFAGTCGAAWPGSGVTVTGRS
jgi:hypothetical protein